MLKTTLTNDMKSAMKEKDKETLATIRLITSAIKNKEIQNKNQELEDEDIISLIQKEEKQTKESLDAYQKVEGDYQGKIVELENRLKTLEKYLPTPLTEEELTAIVQDAISETGASSKKDMGKVMEIVRPKTKGRADGSLVSKKVQEFLS